ncbi:hypothetical protein BJX65DRAFT_55840 [Aspergillus insuetus]
MRKIIEMNKNSGQERTLNGCFPSQLRKEEIASSVNRTRASSMATTNSTTRPMMLVVEKFVWLYSICQKQFHQNYSSYKERGVIIHGMSAESLIGLGPFIIMEYIKHEGDFIDALNIPGRSRDDRPILDPNVS